MYNNGKDLIDYLGVRCWDTSSTFRAYLLRWTNQILNNLTQNSESGFNPIDFYKFPLKKRMHNLHESEDMSPDIPSTPSVAIASGGSLTDGTQYKVYVTFVIYDDEARDYIESQPSVASSTVTGTAVNKLINITALDVYPSDSTIHPNTIYRNIYVSKKSSSDSAFGDPFYYGQVQNNTATTTTVTSEPTSTRTPPSDSELAELCNEIFYFQNQNKYLERHDLTKILKNKPGTKTSATGPYWYDFIGPRKIFIYPQFANGSTTANKTISYFIYRRPHTLFYETDSILDLPIDGLEALEQGVVWKSYQFRDRSGKESEEQTFLMLKQSFQNKYKRNTASPSSVTDVNGDFSGWGVE